MSEGKRDGVGTRAAEGSAKTAGQGMAEELVRQVTDEVLKRMKGAQPRGAEPSDSATRAVHGPSSCACGPQCSCHDACGGAGARASGPRCATCPEAGFCPRECPDRIRLLMEHGIERIGCAPGIGAVDRRLAAMLDHTLLRPDATSRQIAQLCEEAHCHGFATVCLQPMWVPLAARILEGSRVKVCTVVGFPHGANRSEVKAYETKLAVGQGAREIDMVIPIGAMKEGDLKTVSAHVGSVVRAALPGVVTKVILETSYLTREEKVAGCQIARDLGAIFVKTSTGFGPSGATLEDVRLMRDTVGPTMGVKAAGGIRDTEAARQMVQAGATRIGASASIKIAGQTAGRSGGGSS